MCDCGPGRMQGHCDMRAARAAPSPAAGCGSVPPPLESSLRQAAPLQLALLQLLLNAVKQCAIQHAASIFLCQNLGGALLVADGAGAEQVSDVPAEGQSQSGERISSSRGSRVIKLQARGGYEGRAIAGAGAAQAHRRSGSPVSRSAPPRAGSFPVSPFQPLSCHAKEVRHVPAAGRQTHGAGRQQIRITSRTVPHTPAGVQTRRRRGRMGSQGRAWARAGPHLLPSAIICTSSHVIASGKVRPYLENISSNCGEETKAAEDRENDEIKRGNHGRAHLARRTQQQAVQQYWLSQPAGTGWGSGKWAARCGRQCTVTANACLPPTGLRSRQHAPSVQQSAPRYRRPRCHCNQVPTTHRQEATFTAARSTVWGLLVAAESQTAADAWEHEAA